MKQCTNCSNVIPAAKAKNKNVFCDSLCANQYRVQKKIDDWLSGAWDGNVQNGISSAIRKYVLDKSERTCQRCGWNEINPSLGYSPVELSHIDGNYMNNRPENHEVLCPNCHSLEPTYKALNKNGRGWRSDYSQFELVKAENRKQQSIAHLRICACGKSKEPYAKTCIECFNTKGRLAIDWPEVESVVSLVEQYGYLQAGKVLGVSDNAVRSFLRRHGVDPKSVKRRKSSGTA